MKQMWVVVLIACLVTATASAAPAGKRPKRTKRTVEATYSQPAAGKAIGGDLYGACKHDDGIGCVAFYPEPGELFAHIEIVDDLGQPVHAAIDKDESGTGIEFCGTTEEPVFLGSDDPFLVWVYPGPCADGTPAMASSGRITTVLSNYP